MAKEKKKETNKKSKSKLIIIPIVLIVIVAIIGVMKIKTKVAPSFDEFTSIEYGIYTGQPKEGDTFVPSLTLTPDNKFEFRVAKTYTYNGEYHIAHNRVILTITEEKSYTFGKQGEYLVLIEDVENYLTSGNNFKLWGTIDSDESGEETTKESTE